MLQRLAILSASVPPEVKKNSEGEARNRDATLFLAFSIKVRASRPWACMEDGFP
jgi:hypothetical protein